jgi:hypothetical protein
MWMYHLLLCTGWTVTCLHAETSSMVYERLLADRDTACPLLFPLAEESAACEATRDCMDTFTRELDFATFKKLCDVIHPAVAGDHREDQPPAEDKRPGPAEVRLLMMHVL